MAEAEKEGLDYEIESTVLLLGGWNCLQEESRCDTCDRLKDEPEWKQMELPGEPTL